MLLNPEWKVDCWEDVFIGDTSDIKPCEQHWRRQSLNQKIPWQNCINLVLLFNGQVTHFIKILGPRRSILTCFSGEVAANGRRCKFWYGFDKLNGYVPSSAQTRIPKKSRTSQTRKSNGNPWKLSFRHGWTAFS